MTQEDDNNGYNDDYDHWWGLQPGFFCDFGVILFDSTIPKSEFRRRFSSGRLKQHWLNR